MPLPCHVTWSEHGEREVPLSLRTPLHRDSALPQPTDASDERCRRERRDATAERCRENGW